MKLNQCKYCGTMFQSTDVRVVCDECRKTDDILFTRIEDYLRRYPNSNALQVSDGLSIPVFEVIRFIDEGRLQLTKGSFEKM